MKTESLTLTVDEIKDLAQFAGLLLQETQLTEEEIQSEKETEIVITQCPVRGVQDDDEVILHFRHIAYWDEYPDEGVMPLGDPIQPDPPLISDKL